MKARGPGRSCPWSEGKEEAAQKTDGKTKEEADQKADQKAKEEADQKAKDETDQKAKGEAAQKADENAKEEADQKEKELYASYSNQGQRPTESEGGESRRGARDAGWQSASRFGYRHGKKEPRGRLSVSTAARDADYRPGVL
eukprot:gene18933-6289_t